MTKRQQRRRSARRKEAQARGRRAMFATGMALGAAFVAPAVSQANDFTVGATGDSATAVTDCADMTNTDCTLRDAIGAATAAGDRVVFSSSLSGSTITLQNANGSIQVPHAIDIVGPGAGNLAVDGAALDDSILKVELGYSDDVHVSGLTFENGGSPSSDTGQRRDGGAIYNKDAALTVSNSTFDGNNAFTGGAIDSHGALTVQSSQFTNNYANNSGGAIAQYGNSLDISGSSFTDGNTAQHNRGGAIVANNSAVTISNSTISGNHADTGFGGGLNLLSGPGIPLQIDHTTISDNTAIEGAGAYVEQGGTIANSTLSGNHASAYGGGLRTESHYGAVTLAVNNTTISGNSATGGGGGVSANTYESYTSTAPRSSLILDSSTVSGNSTAGQAGGIYAYGYIYAPTASPGKDPGPTLRNTIVAANSARGTDQDLRVAGADDPFTAAFSLIQNAPASSFTSSGPNVLGKDPLLAPLASNGGPTQTRALGAGSPAIDAGSTSLTTDQRGLARPFGSAPDIGAFEDQTPRAAPVVPFTPKPTPPDPRVDIGKLKTGANFVTFRLHCNPGAACAGAAALFTTERLHGKHVVSLARTRKKKLKVGSKSFSLAAGQTKTIKVKLNSRGRKLIPKFHKLPVRLQVALKQSNGKSAVVKTARVTLKSPKKRKH